MLPQLLITRVRILFYVSAALFLAGEARAQKPQLITEEGHTSVVRTVAFSPNGKIIASGSEDKKIKLWDVKAGMEFASLPATGGTIMSVLFADDRTLVSIDDRGDVKLWSAANGEEIRTLEEPSNSNQNFSPVLAISADRKTLVVGGRGEDIIFWDLAAKTKSILPAPGVLVQNLAFNFARRLLATAGADGSILIWNIDTKTSKTLYTSEAGAKISSVAFSPDGKYLVAGSSDNYIRVWSIENDELRKSWVAHAAGVNCVTYDQNGNHVISGGNDNKIRIWSSTGTETAPAMDYKLPVRAVAASPTENLIAAGGNQSSVTLWDATNGHELKRWEAHTFSVTDVVVSPDGNTVATGHGHKIKLWDISTGRELRTFREFADYILALAFSSDGNKLASCSYRAGIFEVNIWEVASGQVTFHAAEAGALRIAFNKEGTALASSSTYGRISLWDLSRGVLSRSWPIPSTPQTKAIAFDKDGELVTGSDDGVIRVWNINQNDVVKSIPAGIGGIRSLDISDDGTMLAVRGTYRAKIFNLPTWQESPGDIRLSNYDARIKFSHDGKKLAVGEYEFNERGETVAPVRLWDVATGKLLQTMYGHQHGVTAVAFSKDSSRVLSGSWDNTWKVWSVDSNKELCTIIALDQSDWVVVTPEGRFDASPAGMERLHWRIGDELITLTQLKERYWEPGLLSKLLLLNAQPLVTNVETLDNVKLFPKVEYNAPAQGSTNLRLKLSNRGGGIGRVQVKINNTEVYDDARGVNFDSTKNEAVIPIDISNASIVPGQPNNIQIIAWNSDGYLASRPETREWIPEGATDNSPPEFYAVIVGVSEYSDPQIKLKYTAKDAEAMAGALELGAKALFPGPGRGTSPSRVHISLLRTSTDPQSLAPTKANIKAAFEAVKPARPQDVLVVYLSGHGLSISGDASQRNNLYLFLTKEARSKSPQDYIDPAVVEQRTITSRELAAWIRPIRALHRVMILDTCAAGAVAQDLNDKGDDISSYQLRAIDKLQDRTGFFVLMGSAANSVSYEASKYEQSLLTYSLLRRMKTEQPYPESIDVGPLFHDAVEDVDQLARGNNGIQKPEIRIPEGGTSFPIGLLTNDDKRKIKLESAKPVVLRPTLLNSRGSDNLQLTPALRKLLDKETYMLVQGSTFQPVIVYVNADALQGAYVPTGIYFVDGNDVRINFVLTKDGKETSFEVTGSKLNLDELLARILEGIYQRVEASPD